MKAFPGAISTHLNYYVRPRLDEFEYDAAMKLMRINDILWWKN